MACLPKKFFDINIKNLFFNRKGFLFNDYEKIFYSQFKKTKKYEQIVTWLSEGQRSLDEISRYFKIPSGGSLKSYLDNLESAQFIRSVVSYDKTDHSKNKKYKLSDDYLRFYFKYIFSKKKLIQNSELNQTHMTQSVLKSWQTWAGFCFENYCQKNAFSISVLMGFSEYVESFGPLLQTKNINTDLISNEGFQIDLVYLRSDKVITICEIKYSEKKINCQIIPDVNKKMNLFNAPRGYSIEKALISIHGPDQALIDSDFFDHYVDLNDLSKD